MWMLLMLAAAAAVVASASKPKRTPTGPLGGGPKVGSAEWVLVADFRPEPGPHGMVTSKWCLPQVAGGGCRSLDVELGYPEGWVPAGDFATTLRDFVESPDLWVQVDAYASTNNPESLSGDPKYFTAEPCWTWVWMGDVSKGPLPLVETRKGDTGEECQFAVSAEPPRLVLVPEDEVTHLVFSSPAAQGSVARFVVRAQWRQ